jgi:hypothetical protein
MTDNKIASRDRQVQTVQERHANVGLPVTLEPGPVDLSTISGCNALAMWPHLQDRTPPCATRLARRLAQRPTARAV